jgi:hypothetical protein
MSDTIAPLAEASNGGRAFIANLRATFGPALIGLLGGGATAVLLIPTASILVANMTSTYERFPSEPQPWFATHWTPSPWLQLSAWVLGFLLPVLTGLGVVWVARPRDAWATVSAGITAGLASTLASFAAFFGWIMAIALVIVPSIYDLSLVCDATTPPPGVIAQNPQDAFVERHPDLKDVADDERSKAMFARLISDLTVGTARAVWVGLLEAACLCGMVAFFGTMIAGYLRRSSDGRFLPDLVRYVELTVPATLAFNLVVTKVLLPNIGHMATWPHVLAGLGIAAVVIFVALQRGQWPVRLGLALIWFLCLAPVGGGSMGIGEIVAYVVTPLLLAAHYLQRRRLTTTPAVAVS